MQTQEKSPNRAASIHGWFAQPMPIWGRGAEMPFPTGQVCCFRFLLFIRRTVFTYPTLIAACVSILQAFRLSVRSAASKECESFPCKQTTLNHAFCSLKMIIIYVYIYIYTYIWSRVPCCYPPPPPPPPHMVWVPQAPPPGPRPRAPGSCHLRSHPHPDPLNSHPDTPAPPPPGQANPQPTINQP